MVSEAVRIFRLDAQNRPAAAPSAVALRRQMKPAASPARRPAMSR